MPTVSLPLNRVNRIVPMKGVATSFSRQIHKERASSCKHEDYFYSEAGCIGGVVEEPSAHYSFALEVYYPSRVGVEVFCC